MKPPTGTDRARLFDSKVGRRFKEPNVCTSNFQAPAVLFLEKFFLKVKTRFTVISRLRPVPSRLPSPLSLCLQPKALLVGRIAGGGKEEGLAAWSVPSSSSEKAFLLLSLLRYPCRGKREDGATLERRSCREWRIEELRRRLCQGSPLPTRHYHP